jgi:hypothetical protein
VSPLPDPITKNTVLLSIDVESNGLHGEAFAVGAVLMRADGQVLDEFVARCPIEGEVDKWVKANVLKPMKALAQTHDTAIGMRDDFWKWYRAAKDKAEYVMVDNGYPVEARFLLSCQDDNLEERYWDHPFPLLDLSSMLLQVGLKPLSVRHQLVAEDISGQDILQHNPRFDAYVSALAAIKVFKMSGQLKD